LEKQFPVPADVLGKAIVERLQENDCVEKGWILKGFPVTQDDVKLLKENGITPNR
jgi:adenylate kinase